MARDCVVFALEASSGLDESGEPDLNVRNGLGELDEPEPHGVRMAKTDNPTVSFYAPTVY